ncbi:MAG: ABC transporter ATP-binding protein, partial [bacterium]
MSDGMIFAVEMRGIVKTFPRIVANRRATIQVRAGEIHALIGENGAGKSTLMKILYGLYQPDEGTVWLRGRQVELNTPWDAIRQGIGMVHQHFMLVPPLTVAENVVLGMEPTRRGLIDLRRAEHEIDELSEIYGLEVHPSARVEDLSVGLQQRVEIIKVLYRGAEILILDEPTAVLTPQEVADLFKILRNLKAQGKTILFITHKLKEVKSLSDRVTVMRHGETAAMGLDTASTSTEELARLMVGRPVLLHVEKKPATPGEVVLRVEGVSATSSRRLPALKGVSLEIRGGEILGIAGVEGNGQTELLEALTGLRRTTAGRILMSGRDVTGASPRQMFEAGVGVL